MSPKGNEKRSLPRKHNPLLAPDKTPEHNELVRTRRLGQTHLSVKPGQVGLSNATKPEHLGMFDYAHLKAPLPKNLHGSEIFAPSHHQPHPEAYFLMRRSSDGYISATGMFKASFPWAKISEEQAERDYIKSLETTSQDEVANNVWIPESYALELAEEYKILPWITALLDKADIADLRSPEDSKKAISPPPKFTFTANDKTSFSTPHATPRGATPRARGRPRAASPTKNGTPAPKMANLRKPRTTKATNAANAATAREANASLQATLDSAPSLADSESVDGDKVLVEAESAVEVNGDAETTTTNVKVVMPSGSKDLPLPDNPEEMIEQAKAMVEEARKLNGDASTSSQPKKRKAEELDDDDDEESKGESQPAKRTKLLEQELKRERVRRRAILGLTATLVVGAIIPYVI